jgi:uncharacterized protein (DUF1697 family)
MVKMNMETYIAFLRGVNVSGKNPIKMDDLKNYLLIDGYSDVITYIQSGNIILKHPGITNKELANRIQRIIKLKFGFDVSVVVKKKDELKLIIKKNPFTHQTNNEPSKFHITLLEEQPRKEFLEKLTKVSSGDDMFQIVNDTVYLYCPNGYGRTKLNNTFFENKLKVMSTTRNWNTIINLAKLSE